MISCPPARLHAVDGPAGLTATYELSIDADQDPPMFVGAGPYGSRIVGGVEWVDRTVFVARGRITTRGISDEVYRV
jgi:hypothetical protein